ncbi:MAG: hypothetical protein ACLRWQ_11985 [Flavonifractor plautii]
MRIRPTGYLREGFINGKLIDSAIIGVLCFILCLILQHPLQYPYRRSASWWASPT